MQRIWIRSSSASQCARLARFEFRSAHVTVYSTDCPDRCGGPSENCTWMVSRLIACLQFDLSCGQGTRESNVKETTKSAQLNLLSVDWNPHTSSKQMFGDLWVSCFSPSDFQCVEHISDGAGSWKADVPTTSYICKVAARFRSVVWWIILG
jgi:hypothetical protein